MSLKRSKPLDRGKPLAGGGELKRVALERATRLKPMSAKRRREQPARDAVRQRALQRAGYRCQGRDVWPEITCWGPLDVDEITSRGVRPGSHLEDDQTQVLCRGHHEARHRHPEEAARRGLRRRSWENG